MIFLLGWRPRGWITTIGAATAQRFLDDANREYIFTSCILAAVDRWRRSEARKVVQDKVHGSGQQESALIRQSVDVSSGTVSWE